MPAALRAAWQAGEDGRRRVNEILGTSWMPTMGKGCGVRAYLPGVIGITSVA
jgi:hypothetical protein